MIDHVLGRPSTKSRRLQVLAVLAFWSFYLSRGNKHGPPGVRFWSRLSTHKLTSWQTVALTMLYLYAARNFSTLVGLASPEPMANMYDATYFRATWMLTALDAGFWTAMKIRTKWLRDLASIVFSVYYLFAAERADEKVRKVRGMLTVEHLRVAWNKTTSPYLAFFQGLMRPRFTRWPPRQIRIPRPGTSDYKDPVSAWLYYDGPLTDLERHNKLILNIPGGGFVAMDPRCNDDLLLCWAAKTGLPILSLDYKKAPEYPYPYALNECFDVYTTIIKSRGRCIGMSGKEMPRLVLAGDSAGGNLVTSTVLMIIERSTTPMQRLFNNPDLPLPDGVVLFYPALDMNIGNWMSDEQMSLIKDRRTRGTNRSIIRRKSMQYNDLVGTPHHSDAEEDATPPAAASSESSTATGTTTTLLDNPFGNTPEALRSSHPEYSHCGPSSLNSSSRPGSPEVSRKPSPKQQQQQQQQQQALQQLQQPTKSFHPQPLKTRLAMSSMISYFNDRVLSPELMRAMIILYIGPHNRPDFSQDYLLSPVLTPDALLEKFPKAFFLTGERDPLVDDTVIFSGRLRRVKEAAHLQREHERDAAGLAPDETPEPFRDRDVAEVALLPGVSHGFLQFPALYPPAWKVFERSAGWIEDLFADADARREREAAARGRRRSGAVAAPAPGAASTVPNRNANGNGSATAGRHHLRTESSGDEDRPLEISMTKLNRGRTSPQAEAQKRTAAENGNGVGNGTGNDLESSVEVVEVSPPPPPERKGKGKNGRSRAGTMRKKHSLVRLNSSDDLLGRRMQGLAGGLTGVGEDD